MIGRLTGTLIEKSPPELVIDVQGVGYEVQAPMSTIFNLPEVGQQVTLFTHLSVSENAHNLFAFGSRDDRQLFRTLIKVSGVGPKLAVGILSGMNAQEFVRCVQDGDANMLVKLPGVGKKTAERLLIEMRDRLKDFVSDWAEQAPVSGNDSQSTSDARREAESALVALGYKPTEASKAVSRVAEEAESSSEMIRLALKAMNQ